MSQTPATTSSGFSSNLECIFVAALKSYKKKTRKDLKNHDLFRQLETCDSPAAILAAFQADQFDSSRTESNDRLNKWLIPTINVLSAFSDTLGGGVSLVFPPAQVVVTGVGVLLSAARDVAASQDTLIDIFGRIESFFGRLETYTNVPLTPAMTNKMVQITVEILDILAIATKEMKQSRAKKFFKRLIGRTKLEDGLKNLDKLTNEEVAMASAELLRITHNIDNTVTRVDEGVSRVDENVLAVKSEVELVNDSIKVVDDKVQTLADDGMAAAKDVKVILQQTTYGVENLKLVNNNVLAADDRLRGIADDCKETAEEVKVMLQQAADGVDDVKWNQIRESLRKWQSPPDPSTNHHIVGGRQHAGTAGWFIKSEKCGRWKASGSLLWIHGKPGSGKSVLCSAVINDITTLCEAGLASMAYFYFDFRDVDKKSHRTLLPSLLVQLSSRSNAFCDILFRLYETHDNGARQPSDKALTQCLKEMLALPNQRPIYLIMDALDECPDTSDVPSAREQVLNLVGDLVRLRLPDLRIFTTSRPEVDIGEALEPLASQMVSLQNELGQKKDIVDYVRHVVYSGSGTFMKRWRKEDKDHVIEILSGRADGMFRWVFCQLELLRNCLPQNVRRVLQELPASLDETYERMLREILKANPDQAYHLLQCLTVATRPLSVDELAEILALNFDGAKDGIPALNKDWRWDDERQGVLATCSSLIVVVEGYVGSSKTRVVQFAHFSVKEFLTSDRLADIKADISRFRIRLEPAHTVISQACLAILLQSDHDHGVKSTSPLANYAARHWVDHARFGNVSLRIEDGMRRLFDPEKPYFTAWLNSYDPDIRWTSFLFPHSTSSRFRGSKFISLGEADSPLCLYYAALCGFYDLSRYLITKYLQHIDATVGLNKGPLAAALRNKHFRVADLLRQHGAVLPLGFEGRTLLHAASADGLVDIAQWLLNIGADANAQEDGHRTPLHFAVANGRLELVRILLGHGVDVNAAAATDRRSTPLCEASSIGLVEIARLLIEYGSDIHARDHSQSTPLHLASSCGHTEMTQLLINHGVDIHARDQSQSTPLHLTSSWGHTKTTQLLIDHGADIHARDQSQSTPLHLASSWGHTKTTQLLINHGADVHARDQSQSTPLHLASSWGHTEIVQLLLKHGAGVRAQDQIQSDSTPLHLALSKRNAEIVRLLIEHGADIHARDQSQSTPLHLASSWGNTEITQLIIEHGADVHSQDQGQSTPLHLASSCGHTEITQLLINHGADVHALDQSQSTPLHLASSWGHTKITQLLINHGADVHARDQCQSTPLLLASSWGNAKIIQLLIERGADVHAQDQCQSTPLHLSLSQRNAEISQLLIKHEADVHARDQSQSTPLHLASSWGNTEITQLLIEHGADVHARDQYQSTPLHRAQSAGTAQLLIEHGADVRARDQNQSTPLHLTWDAAQLLIDHGADVHALDQSQSTPLHLARNAEIAQLLIDHGADVHARDQNQSTPLHMASSSPSMYRAQPTVRLLIEHGASVNPYDKNHQTPLHRVSSCDYPNADSLCMLLENGADVDVEDNEGQTPFQIASSKPHRMIAQLLLYHRNSIVSNGM